jgi:hypothetical protein
MKTGAKNSHASRKTRGITQATKRPDRARRSTVTKQAPKNALEATPAKKLEQAYLQLFTSNPLPSHGLYTDEDSLEQPSALKYVPSTSNPSAIS